MKRGAEGRILGHMYLIFAYILLTLDAPTGAVWAFFGVSGLHFVGSHRA